MLRGMFLWGLVLASCGGSSGTTTTTSSEPREASERATTAAEQGSTEAAAEPATTPSEPAPVLALRGTPQPHGGTVEIALENRGDELARVAPRITVERADASGAFAPIDGIASLTLRPDCAHEADACVELAPGAALYPPAWLGTRGDAQCICTRCAPVEAGTYRFVVTSCGGAHRVEGEPFDVAAR